MTGATSVLILGAGFAGLTVAQELEKQRATALDVSICDANNYMLFTPMLPEAATGSIEIRHIVNPLRSSLKKTRFVMGQVVDINLATKAVESRGPGAHRSSFAHYDHLILALGSVIIVPPDLPGVAARVRPLKDLGDAVALRAMVVNMFERAVTQEDVTERRRLLTFVVVGGGFNGVEVAGELNAFAASLAPYYSDQGVTKARVVVVEEGDRLLEQLPERFGEKAATMFASRDIDVLTNESVLAADALGVTLASGRRLDSELIVWSAGVKPAAIVGGLPVPLSKHGAVRVEPDLSVATHAGVWALGDCAQIPKPGGGYFPPTAQHAIREATLLARNVLNSIAGEPTEAFSYTSPGMMASLGDRQGVAELYGAMITGFPAWLLWRAYYLGRLPGFGRKARVALDWLLALAGSRELGEGAICS